MSTLPTLTAADFDDWFRAVHGVTPFPWQRRLARHLAQTGHWPALLDLPTAAGKTAALDAALFHLALEADRADRRARRRIALVVDRRLVVDGAYERAERIRQALETAPMSGTDVVSRVKCRLLALGGEQPLAVARLRGGIPKEDVWTRDPTQPLLLLSTVDQFGSRLLFRGYGLSEYARPIHAGLLAEDCLLLLDEAHLSEPFRQTLDWVGRYLGADWRRTPPQRPLRVIPMSATPGEVTESFGLMDEDRANQHLQARLQAAKPARLVAVREQDQVAQLVKQAAGLLEAVREETPTGGSGDLFDSAGAPVLGVIVNRVATARAVFEALDGVGDGEPVDRVLLMGRNRPLDARCLLAEFLPRMRAGRRPGDNPRPLCVVATQTVEVGADLDFDALVTESAPLDALRQRFGRLNRLGRTARSQAVIVHTKSAKDDPIYGSALGATWDWLQSVAEKSGKGKKPVLTVDFGIGALADRLPDGDELKAFLTPRKQAPVLMPAYVDLLAQTSPAPALEPEVPLLLHGPDSGPPDVQLVWRADLPDELEGMDLACHAAVAALPPSGLEALSLPVWTVRAWLQGDLSAQPTADLEGLPPQDEAVHGGRPALRWQGQGSAVVRPGDIKPGDTLVVPVGYGGLDRFGWNPASRVPVTDRAESAALEARRRWVLRLAPGCLAQWSQDAAVTAACVRAWEGVLAELDETRLAPPVADALAALEPVVPEAIRARLAGAGEGLRLSRYGQGVTAHWLLQGRSESGGDFSDEDDDASLTREVTLDAHCRGVGDLARRFARSLGLAPEQVADLGLAGDLHDLGKADPRFQTWLRGGERAATLGRPLLAKSGLDRADRMGLRQARQRSGYPRGGRHECASVQLLRAFPELLEPANDRELVAYLVGAHHGRGRPFMPVVADPGAADLDTEVTVLGHRLRLQGGHGLERLESGWPALFWRLVGRYGWWGLAYLEAVLRLADHRRSAEGG